MHAKNALLSLLTDECRWLYSQVLGADANFRQKSQDCGIKDITLRDSPSYFVQSEEVLA